MHPQHLAVLCLAAAVCLTACNRKTVPETAGKPTVTYNGRTLANNTASNNPAAKRVMVKRKPAPPMPKMIMVNDKVAKKNIDGRLYYDVEGHRYWRNYNDGKYYLFNRAMYSDPAFKPH